MLNRTEVMNKNVRASFHAFDWDPRRCQLCSDEHIKIIILQACLLSFSILPGGFGGNSKVRF